VAYQAAQFWDVRAPTLEKQIHHVVNGPGEFGTDFLSVLERLKKHPGYPARFGEAFPHIETDPIAVGTVTKALAQFMRSLARFDSPFDRYMRGETNRLAPAVRRGFNLFAGKALCATCHFAPTFGGTVPPRYLETETEVLGVPKTFPAPPGAALQLDSDPGRFPIHYAPPFLHSFKTPSLRNVALTAPYMHNGSMKTLEDVMDFYNAGGGLGLGLNVPDQTLPSDSLGLTKQEMDDVVAFMKALTDGQ
jgi:cytochrome c peroxidase